MDEVRFKILWSNLFGLRFMLTILPQNGYISIQEFSGSSKIMAGDLFAMNLTVTSQSTPQGIIFPLLSSGIPLMLLRTVDQILTVQDLITPYFILVVPRIWSTFLSVLCDIYVFKIAISSNYSVKEACTAMVLFASSYITWVYFTRTFSVGLETIIYGAILHESTKILRNIEAVPKTKTKESFLLNYKHIMRKLNVITSLLCLGMCIDPTFINIGILPIIYCGFQTYNLFSRESGTLLIFHMLLSILTSIFFTYSMLALVTAIYYEPNFITYLGNLSIMKMIHYLLNFMSSSGGFHNFHFGSITLEIILGTFWKILHVPFKFLALFGPLLVLLFGKIKHANLLGEKRAEVLIFYTFVVGFINLIFSDSTSFTFLTMILPTVILSAKHVKMSKLSIVSWCVFNFCAFMYHGIFLHGGVVPSMEFLNSLANIHTSLAHSPQDLDINVVYYNTLPPIRHLTAWENSRFDAGEAPRAYLNIVDLSQSTEQCLRKKLDELLLDIPEAIVYLIAPGSMSCNTVFRIHNLYHLELYFQIFPHLDFEMMPDLTQESEWCTSSGHQHINFVNVLLDKLSLNIFKVSRLAMRKSSVADNIEEAKILLQNYASKS